MNLLQTIKSWTGFGPGHVEGGPVTAPIAWTSEGGIPTSWPWSYWQQGLKPLRAGAYNPTAYACIHLYARTIAQLPGVHRIKLADGGTELRDGTALARRLRSPNTWQSQSDFLYNGICSLLENGNWYALAQRTDRNDIDSLHLLNPRYVQPYLLPDGDVFYSVGIDPLIDPKLGVDSIFSANRRLVPARDMLHVRVYTPRNPLIGESPLMAAYLPMMTQERAGLGLQRYYENMSVPSGTLNTDLVLTEDQVKELRARWNDQSSGENIGGVPILTAGLKWMPNSQGLKATDAQVIEAMKYSSADIARVFGVPLALIDDMTGATYANTEQLVEAWRAQGLGFYVNHIELAYDQLFGLQGTKEFTEFDIDALLRPDFAARMEALAKGVQGGILAPNEARRMESLPAVKAGDMPRVQQQLLPLDAVVAPANPPAPAKPAANDDEPPTDEEAAAAADKAYEALTRGWQEALA